MSKIFNCKNLSAQLRALEVKESFCVSLKQGRSFNDAMKSVTAACVRLNIKVAQEAIKGLSTNYDNDKIINLINIKRLK